MTRTVLPAGRRHAFSLIEVMVATVILSIVIGPLMYLWSTGQQTTSARHSAALMGYHIAAERIRHDLSQMVYPDGPAPSGGARHPFFRISNPGPDEGSSISFWIPRRRQGGTDSVPREVPLVPITYSLEPIPSTATRRLVRQVGPDKTYVGSAVIRYLWFKHLRSFADDSGPIPPGVFGNFESSFGAQAIRVYLTAAEKPATDEQMDGLPEAQKVKTFGLGFLRAVVEPTLMWRMVEPDSQDRFRFTSPEGSLPSGISDQ